MISCDVQKHCDPSVRLGARRLNELNTNRRHPPLGLVEVVDVQEEADAASQLSPKDGCLLHTISLGEQDPRLSTERAHNHPSLWMSIVGHSWGILHQLKPQLPDEELNRRVIALRYERDQL